MAFDPDEYLRKTATPGLPQPQAPTGVDPDEYLRKTRPLTDAEKRARGLPVLGEDEGPVMAGLRAAGQAATLGFSDELAGVAAGAKALVTPGASAGDAFRQTRDEERRAIKSDAQAHPTATTIGTVAGTVASAALPGAGAGWVARGAGLGAKVARSAAVGAGYGAASGYGGSDAEDAAGQVKDATKGALVGGAVGAALPAAIEGAKKIGGFVADTLKRGQGLAKDDAQAMAVQKLIEARAEGKDAFRQAAQDYAPLMADEAQAATASAGGKGAEKVARDAVARNAWQELIGDVASKVKRDAGGPLAKNKPGMMRVLRNDGGLAAAVIGGEAEAKTALTILQARKAKYGKALEELYERHQGSPEAQATLDEYLAPLIKMRDQYAKSPQTLARARAMEGEIERAKQVYGERGTVSPQEMRVDYRAAQDRGFGAGGEFSPSEVKALQREVSDGLRGVLHRKIEQSSAKMPGAADDLQRLRLLNKRFSDYSRFDEILAQKHANLEMGTPPVGKLMALANKEGGWARYAAKSAGKLVDPREWVAVGARPVIGAGRWANREAQAAAARSRGRKIWEEAMKEVDDLTPGSPPLSGSTEPAAAQASAMSNRMADAIARATARGVPLATAVKLARLLLDGDEMLPPQTSPR